MTSRNETIMSVIKLLFCGQAVALKVQVKAAQPIWSNPPAPSDEIKI